MAWTDIETTVVDTPEGIGTKVKDLPNGQVRVKVGTQLYDLDGDKVVPVPGAPRAGDGVEPGDGLIIPTEGATPDGRVGDLFRDDIGKGKEGDDKLKVGDRVQHKTALDRRTMKPAEGVIIKETQRSFHVQFDDGDTWTQAKANANEQLKKIENKKKEEKPEDKPQEQKPGNLSDAMAALLGGVNQEVKDEIERSVDGELKELREQVKKTQKLEIKVGDKLNTVKGRKHFQLETLLTYAGLRLATLLVGMAGTGKTHAAEQVAEGLGLPFYSMSVGAQTSKSDIIGYMDANGRYVKTFFREAYENGGVFLMDEIDAGNANVLIQVNAALSNGLAAFPDKMVKKHEDFVFVASANTYGNGANRQYVGRNQLDAATLDRFAILDWKIDQELEKDLAVGNYGKAWHKAVRAARDFIAEKNIRALITPRATQKGSTMLASGLQVDTVIQATLLGSVPEDKKKDIIQVATRVFDQESGKVPGLKAEQGRDVINYKDIAF